MSTVGRLQRPAGDGKGRLQHASVDRAVKNFQHRQPGCSMEDFRFLEIALFPLEMSKKINFFHDER